MWVTISLLNCSQKLMHTMYSMHFFQYKLHHNSTNLLLQQGSWLGGEKVLLEKEEDLHVPVGVFTVNANAFFHKFFTSHLLWLDWGFNNCSSYNTSGITNCLLSWITFCVWSIGFHFISIPDCLWSCSNILLTTIKKKHSFDPLTMRSEQYIISSFDTKSNKQVTRIKKNLSWDMSLG